MSFSTENLDKSQFQKLLTELSNKYYNNCLDDDDEPVSDEIYDNLLNIYKNKFGEYKNVGATPVNKNKEELPKYMGSLNKIRTEKEINRWVKKNNGPYIITDKIDGVSALYNGTKLWTRGDGNIGTNISHILKYINIPKIKNGFVRGEIVIPKSIFIKKYKDTFSNARNMVSGILNPLTKIPNMEALGDLLFVAYEYFDGSDKSQSSQLEILKRFKFITPITECVDKISTINLTDILVDRKLIADYDMDGLVVVNDKPIPEVKIDNPENAVAFKVEGETIETEVEFVEWNTSKHGILKPRVKVNKVNLCGVDINWATGFNAKFINDNNIGPKSVVCITRSGDVIPYIKEVITESKTPQMPTSDWVWNETGVDIIECVESDEKKKKVIIEFFKTMEAKFVGKSTIDKLYNSGYNNLKLLFNLTIEDLVKIDGIQKKSAERIMEAISNSITDVSLSKIASASGVFGIGFGERKLNSIVNKIPDILTREADEDLEIAIRGIGGFQKTAKQFVDNLPAFKKFLTIHDEIKIKNNEEKEKVHLKSENKLKNKVVVFTGIRNEELEKMIENLGGKITTSVSKNTNILITSKRYSGSTKEIKAEQLGVEILSLEDFREKYI